MSKAKGKTGPVPQPQKFYRMTAFAALMDVSTQAIREWVDKGWLSNRRDDKGRFLFSEADVEYGRRRLEALGRKPPIDRFVLLS